MAASNKNELPLNDAREGDIQTGGEPAAPVEPAEGSAPQNAVPANEGAAPRGSDASLSDLPPSEPEPVSNGNHGTTIDEEVLGDDSDEDFTGTFAAVPVGPGEFRVPLSALGEWSYHLRFGSRQLGEHFAALELTAAEPDSVRPLVVLPLVDGVHPIVDGRFLYFALARESPPMKTLIYARFSSDLQNPRSIEDQITICRERCEREGWEIVDVYTDYAISGAAGISESQRPGIAALLTRVEAGGIDQVLAEATDRVTRHEGDGFTIRERLAFANVRLFTLYDGEITPMIGTIKGMTDANFRKELGAKIKRGQRGTVAQGRSPAGIAYGYRMANRIDANGRALRGLREIDPDQAAVVRRIFEEYADGTSPKRIAERLNADGIPGPRGTRWRATTLRPDRTRGNGLLQNQLYIGRIVHNRTSKVVEPMTRRVRIRPNPQDQWVIEDVPRLRIIDQELWDNVQTGLRRREGGAPVRHRRARHMLSGLGVGGVCGGSWNVRTATFWGCGSRSEGSGCDNNRTISTESYERRVLVGLRERMLDPDLVVRAIP